MTNDQIKHMVNRFLGWRLPEDFHPDNGISFEPEFNADYMAKRGLPPMRRDPIGTNLFNATQVEAMVRHMIEGIPAAAQAIEARRAETQAEEPVQEMHELPNTPPTPDRIGKDAVREAEAWLRAISDWLLANDHDMTLPSGVLDTDPLDIADSLAALSATPAQEGEP